MKIGVFISGLFILNVPLLGCLENSNSEKNYLTPTKVLENIPEYLNKTITVKGRYIGPTNYGQQLILAGILGENDELLAAQILQDVYVIKNYDYLFTGKLLYFPEQVEEYQYKLYVEKVGPI